MTEVLEKPPVTLVHKAAERCQHYDDDCKDVVDHLTCWSGGEFNGPSGETVELERFPGVCPFVFGMKE